MRLPQKGLAQDEILTKLSDYRKNDMPWRTGRTWAYVYDAGPEVEGFVKGVYADFLTENALDPTAFPSMHRLETELVSMCAHHLKGDDEVVGNFTSGGTESIILAVKTARDFFREKRPEITQPEMILPTTAHAAFQKAAHYLDVKAVLVPVDPETYRVDPEVVRKAITPNTILLVGSAIQYAHGVVDPIRELGQIALEHDLLLHVDGCMGGWLLPYFRRLGAPVPDFEFHVPGVTSISMDLHKYAFAAKGASVILQKNKDLRRHQIYTCASWTGYTVINPTVQSTKSGGPLAAAWAVLNLIGDDGYLEIARTAYAMTKKIVTSINAMDDLRVMGEPDMNLVAVTSDTVSVFHLADEMNSRGWFIQPQLSYDGARENFHLSINPQSEKWVDEFLRDLAHCVEQVKGVKSGDLAATIQEAFAQMDPNDFDESTFKNLLSMAGIDGVGLPEKMAEINEILDALPREFSKKLLTEFINELYTAPREEAEHA